MTASASKKPIPEGTEPNRQEVLSAIDAEIERLASEDRRPGWTQWAIYGSIAAITWKLLEVWKKELFTPFACRHHLFLGLADNRFALPSHLSAFDKD